MRVDVKYVNDLNGNTQVVQLSVSEWEKILLKLKKYDQIFKLKKNLEEAFEEVEILKKSKIKKQSLNDFLNEI